MKRSGSHCAPRKPAVWPAGRTLSFSRMMSGIQTLDSAGTRVLGLSIFTTEPK